MISFIILFLIIVPSGNFMADGWEDFPRIKDVRTDLLEDSETVKLIYVSLTSCVSCAALEKQVLAPLKKSRAYKGEVKFLQISLDSGQSVINFHGKKVSTKEFLKQYNVEFAPTLLFLNHQGQQLNESIKGYYSPDYFSFYVEQGLVDSLKKLQKKSDT